MNTGQRNRHQKPHRRDAETAEKETTKQTSLRTPRLCGEKKVKGNPCHVAKDFRVSSTGQRNRNPKLGESLCLRGFVVKAGYQSATKTRSPQEKTLRLGL